MLTRRETQATTLLKPVRVSNILISDELISYNERKHWASLLRTFADTMAMLIFTIIAGGDIQPPMLRYTLLALALSIAAYMIVTGVWNRYWVGAVMIFIFGASLLTSTFSAVIVAVIAIAGRFVYKFAMWAFYERLFITNRRLIFASGFLNSSIAMMPLTRITDISYKRSALADLLGYGQLRVETAGQDQALGFINFINYPNEFYERLIKRSTTVVGGTPAAPPAETATPDPLADTEKLPPQDDPISGLAGDGYGRQI